MQHMETQGVRPHLVGDAVRRRFLSIVVIAALVTGAVAAFTLTRPATYVSTARVLVRPAIGNALSPNSTVNGQQVTVAMETESNLVTSPAVIDTVNKRLGSSFTSDATPVTAVVPPNTQVVQVTFKAPSPEAAQHGAQAFADAYLAFRQVQADSTRDAQVDSLRSQEVDAKKALKQASTDAGSKTPAPDAQAEAQLQAARLATIQDGIGQLLATEADPGAVITPAPLPSSPTGVNPVFALLGALLLGLGAGLTVAVWRERNDDRLLAARFSDELGLPVLCSLPAERRAGPTLVVDRGQDDALQNAFRGARASLIGITDRPCVVVVSGVSAREPAADVALNLALALAAARYRVAVVDASLGHGQLAEKLNVAAGPGVSEALVDTSRPPEPIRASDILLLRAGADPTASRELYAGHRFAQLVQSLRDDSDYVVLLAPPASSADFGAISLAGDGVVIVVTEARTTRRQLEEVVERSDQGGTGMIGVVFAPRSTWHVPDRERPQHGEQIPVPIRDGHVVSRRPEREEAAGSAPRAADHPVENVPQARA